MTTWVKCNEDSPDGEVIGSGTIEKQLAIVWSLIPDTRLLSWLGGKECRYRDHAV